MAYFTFDVKTKNHAEMVNITREATQKVQESGVQDGVLYLYVPHTTAGVTINEACDPDVCRDMVVDLERQVPWKGDFRHGEGNSAAHIKASLIGSSVQVFIEKGALLLGTWQGIFFCEFDGPRSRKVQGKILKSS